jgi:hypothetical protein
MNAKNILFSLGAAIATSKLAKTVTHLDADDFLGGIGLSRRRSHALENVALVTMGALIGAGAALLFAPMSGPETRARIGRKVDELGEAASQAVREVRDELPGLQQVKSAIRNGSMERQG